MADVKKLIIIGSGPAGYTAAVYAARAELAPLEITGEVYGGQLINTTLVENWPGARDGVMGPELMMAMREQAQKFGTEMIDRYVTKVDFSQKPFRVWIGEDEYQAEAVIVATGATSIMLGIPGEDKLLGRGIATCAVCDAAFYRDKVAAVVGGGDAAIEDTMALTKFAREVKLIVRKDTLRASKIMQKRVLDNPKVEVWWNSEVREARGAEKLEKIVVVNSGTKETKEVAMDGLFYAIGHKPVTEIFKGQLELDQKGYLVTGMNGLGEVQGARLKVEESDGGAQKLWLSGFPTMTSVKGVFGAGDVVDFRYKQAVTAAGMGCQAALDAEKWLENNNE